MMGLQLYGYRLVPDRRRDADGHVRGLVPGDVLRQNQALILVLHKGELKERPAVGCGLSDMLLDDDPLLWRSVIREQMEMDGQSVAKVAITTTGVVLDAEY